MRRFLAGMHLRCDGRLERPPSSWRGLKLACPLRLFSRTTAACALPAHFRTFQINQMVDLARFSAGMNPTSYGALVQFPSRAVALQEVDAYSWSTPDLRRLTTFACGISCNRLTSQCLAVTDRSSQSPTDGRHRRILTAKAHHLAKQARRFV
jgi:hypothetical protein